MRALPIRLLVLGMLFVSFAPAVGATPSGLDPTTAQPAVAALWVQLDGGVHYQTVGRAWALGPVIRAAATEPYAEAPGGVRTVYYFDKARVEVTDPSSTDPRKISHSDCSSATWCLALSRLVTSAFSPCHQPHSLSLEISSAMTQPQHTPHSEIS